MTIPDRAIAPLKELARRILDECGAEWKDVSLVEWTAKVIAEQLRLERAAALREASEICRAKAVYANRSAHGKDEFSKGLLGELENILRDIAKNIEVLLSNSDRSALEAHDAELVEHMKDHLVSMEGWMTPEALTALKGKVRDRALEEAAVYCEALGEPEVANAIREKRGSK